MQSSSCCKVCDCAVALASVGDKAMVELLLAHRADVNATDDKGKTPLRVALAGHRDVLELLRQNGGHD